MQGTDIECIVIGAGVVGLAAARSLQMSGIQTFLVEANNHFGMETSSRNSEVIHAGIYYPSGSLKAELCVEGRERLYDYCEQRGVPHRRIGKLIVATTDTEIATLESYRKSARANGVENLSWVDRETLQEMEPAVRAVGALHSPSTGIIDSHAFMQSLLDDFELAGGHFIRATRILNVEVNRGSFTLHDNRGDTYRTKRLVNSAGLTAPGLARKTRGLPSQHVPDAFFAIGHYYVLQGKSPFRQLVYPVAVAGGLGVHVTLDMAGQARFGPDVRWIDNVDYSFDDSRKSQFVEAIQQYYPELNPDDLIPGYTGIRPKISNATASAADFQIQGPSVHGIPGLVNLFGIESPGLTASLAIAERTVFALERAN